MTQDSPETNEEFQSRAMLVKLLKTTERVLERVLGLLGARLSHSSGRDLAAGALHPEYVYLHEIWDEASGPLASTISTVSKGLKRRHRRALARVGMFGRSLQGKWALLAFDIREGAIKRVLKRLNSMLDSLAEVFPLLHAVKEVKEHMETTMDGLKEPIEWMDLSDLA